MPSAHASANQGTFLDVEDESSQQERLGSANPTHHPTLPTPLARLFAAQSSAPSSPTTIPLGGPALGKTYAIPPPTDCERSPTISSLRTLKRIQLVAIVLTRLEAFLPAIKEANEALEKKVATEGPASVDIENGGPDVVSDADEPNSEDDAIGEDDFDVDDEEGDNEAVAAPSLEGRKPYIEMHLGLGVFEERPQPARMNNSSGALALDSEKDTSDSESTTSSGSSDTGSGANVIEPDLPPAKRGRYA
ncbi:hypothetical protein FRB97_001404 [Tulasnella sp. 331]|nr:hypothetical protein FRB97_001404 [Tulasnella sp. 331]